MRNYTTLNDRPIEAKDTQDLLGVNLYQDALIKFISKSDTPMTIAIQGEWGSGKSSLMKYLEESLCNSSTSRFEGVWINSWEYALFNDDTGALLQIVADITIKLIGESDANDLKNKFFKLIKAAIFVAGRDYRFLDDITKIEAEDSSITIAEVRNQLQKIISDRLDKKKDKDGLIIFIDDLDRIDPTVAVRILEVLKNIFDIDRCIFVIAIDYDVVIKGLKPKFGEMTEKNEREFRSFFDKIIQVPYTLPVSEYRINNFLESSLKSINYFVAEPKDKDTIKDLSNFATLSVGTNPRSIKRLINLLSLIKIINEIKNEKESNKFNVEDQVILFAVVCIQLAYPRIYEVLKKEVLLSDWKSTLITRNSIKWPTEDEIAKVEKTIGNEGKEKKEWITILYILCKNDPYLFSNFLNIKEILEKLNNYVLKAKGDEGEASNYLNSIMELTSVTEVSKNENNTKDRPKIGAQVKTFFKEEIHGKKASPKLIEKLMTPQYSKDMFKLGYPLLTPVLPNEKTLRYWVDPFTINGKEYFVCSQWRVTHQEHFDKWKVDIVKEFI